MSSGPTLVMHEPSQPLTFGLPAAAPPVPAPASAESDVPNLELMCQMFPDVEREVLATVLLHYEGNVEAAVSSLLEEAESQAVFGALEPEDQLDFDAQIAAHAQEELDEEMARALQREFRADDALRRRAERSVASSTPARPSSASAAPASANANAARRLLSRIRSKVGVVRPPNEISASLLGNQGEVADSSAPIEEPLAPTYSPPMPIPTAAAADAPGSLGSSPPSEAKYNSRVDRARAANRARGTSAAGTSPALLPLTAEMLPPDALLPLDTLAINGQAAPPAQAQASGPAEGILI